MIIIIIITIIITIIIIIYIHHLSPFLATERNIPPAGMMHQPP